MPYVLRIDPQATFTPENTYFRDDRVKQVVGLKLQLKSGFGFAKPGMPADGEILAGRHLARGKKQRQMTRRAIGPADRPPIADPSIWKRYGAVEAVRGIDFEVAQGEIFGLIGPDGAGKTSTFQILGGVMEATSGTAEIFGMPAREARSHTGYLTQASASIPT